MSKTEALVWSVFWLGFFASLTTCHVADRRLPASVECVKAGGDWSWSTCSQRKPS